MKQTSASKQAGKVAKVKGAQAEKQAKANRKDAVSRAKKKEK